MLSRSILATVVVALAAPVFAADTFTLDPAHTFPTFEVNHLGYSVMRGRFNKVVGNVTLDRAAKSGSIDASIDTSSIDTGWPDRDTHLKGPDFFNVEKFPAISFRSTSLKFDGDNLVGADGELTLVGVTKPVTLRIANFHCAPHPLLKKEVCGAEGTASFKRSDFGMKYALPAVGDDIKIVLEIEAYKQ